MNVSLAVVLCILLMVYVATVSQVLCFDCYNMNMKMFGY